MCDVSLCVRGRVQAIFVGVPLPGTGAWTGAAMGAMFNLSTRDTILGTILGIVSAAMIMTALVLAGAPPSRRADSALVGQEEWIEGICLVTRQSLPSLAIITQSMVILVMLVS